MTYKSGDVSKMVTRSRKNQISERLIQLRCSKGWSQADATRAMGYENRARISRYESGEREPSKGQILHIAAVYGVSAAWVLYGAVPASPDDYPDFDSPREAV